MYCSCTVNSTHPADSFKVSDSGLARLKSSISLLKTVVIQMNRMILNVGDKVIDCD